jgi:3-oxoacyl-[acyl-carrier protein] reductase
MHPIAIVTGGSSNIGWACVRRLAADHAVVIADLRPPVNPLPAGAKFVQIDVTDAAACQQLMADATGEFGLDILVHSAAITAPTRPIEQIPADEWRRLIDVNLTGAFLIAQAAIPALRLARGMVAMIASRAGRTGYAALNASPSGTKAHYAASKAALLSLVKSLAIELAPDGVRVNAIVPGIDRRQHDSTRALARTGRPHPPWSAGNTRRNCRRGGLPVFRRRTLHHRPCDGCQRRHMDELTFSVYHPPA